MRSTRRRETCAKISLISIEISKIAHLVYDITTRSVCQPAASFSSQSPMMEAEMETAADNAPVNAKWIPDEKNGSMKA